MEAKNSMSKGPGAGADVCLLWSRSSGGGREGLLGSVHLGQTSLCLLMIAYWPPVLFSPVTALKDRDN